jgi:hypothetical protein
VILASFPKGLGQNPTGASYGSALERIYLHAFELI